MMRILIYLILFFFCTSQAMADLQAAKENWDKGEKRLAFNEFVFLAEAGDIEAQYKLGEIYRRDLKDKSGTNIIVKKDKTKSNHWYKLALEGYSLKAEKGDGYAYNRLGYMYRLGLGTEKNPLKAKQNYLQAISIHYDIAEAYAGLLSLPLSLEEEIKYTLECVEKKIGYCMKNLGDLHLLGKGVEENLLEAKNWFRQSCDIGFSFGCFAIAKMHDNPSFWYDTLTFEEKKPSKNILSLMKKEAKPEQAMYWYYRCYQNGDNQFCIQGMDELNKKVKKENVGFDYMIDTLPITSSERKDLKRDIRKHNKRMEKVRSMSNQELKDAFNENLIDNE